MYGRIGRLTNRSRHKADFNLDLHADIVDYICALGLAPAFGRQLSREPLGDQSMELQTFISQSLQQIIAGVRSAQMYVAQNPTGAKINPRGITALQENTKGRKQPHDIHTKLPVHQVEFDVAVTVLESSKGKAGGGLFVAGLGLGGHKMTANESSSISRLKFSVPIVWPDPQTAKVLQSEGDTAHVV